MLLTFSQTFHSAGGKKHKSTQVSLSWEGPRASEAGSPPHIPRLSYLRDLPPPPRVLTWVCVPHLPGDPAGIHGTCSDAES